MTNWLPRQRSLRIATFVACVSASFFAWWPTPAAAQDETDVLVPLYERDPFDRITLDEENASAQIEIFPLQSIDRSVAIQELPRTLTIRRLEDPAEQLYTVSATHIIKLELFHELLLAEANRFIEQGQVDDAFPYLARLKSDFPSTPGLDDATEEFFFADARELFQKGRYDEALQALDEVYRLNPARPGLARVMNRILAEILRTEYVAGNHASVLKKLDYARRRYGAVTANAVEAWEQKLRSDAAKELGSARESFAAGNATEALAAIRQARAIWPTLEGVAELHATILKQYPRVRVAVTQAFQPASVLDARSLQLDWAARRAGFLVTKRVVQIRDFTAEGGQYESRIGSWKVAPDRQLLTLELEPDYADDVHRLSRSMLRAASPGSPGYSPRWAEYLHSVYVPEAGDLELKLIRPALRPEGLLPLVTLGPTGESNLLAGDFQLVPGPSGFRTFQAANGARSNSSGIREIVEQHFADASAAADALMAGEVDLVDRVYPADLPRLKNDATLRVVPYRLPTIHGLVFNNREVLLRSSTFRRGLLYGINRGQFVQNEIAAGGSDSTGQVLSGFAPLGQSEDDPLGYAYDRQIKPRSYDPSLSLILLRLAKAQHEQLTMQHTAAGQGETEDPQAVAGSGDSSQSDTGTLFELPPLVLAYPSSPIASSASSSIAADLRKLGMQIKVRPLPPGVVWPADPDWDLLYLETTIEEPLVNIPELILGQAILGRHAGLVWQAARALQEASSLDEARRQLRKIHKLTFYHTPIIPLWQIIEHKAVSRNVAGDSDSPVSLYHDISNWRLGG